VLRINAGAPEKKKLPRPVFVSGAHDVVLHLQIFEKEFDGQIVVRLDPAHLCRGQDYDRRLFLGEEPVDGRGVPQVQFRAVPRHQVGKPILLQFAHERTANEAAMARDEDFVRFFHGPRESEV